MQVLPGRMLQAHQLVKFVQRRLPNPATVQPDIAYRYLFQYTDTVKLG
jgi:hypothetical protein